MAADGQDPPAIAVDALLAQARLGGPEAVLAARRAAALAERSRPALAREALALALSLDPHDPSPRLDLARLHAEAGELDQAKAEAGQVLSGSLDQGARARAAYFLGEVARLTSELTQARAYYAQALEIEDRLLAANRSDPVAARWYARARGRLADLDVLAGAHDAALDGAAGALAMLRASASQSGETPVLAADIADAEVRLAALEIDAGQANSARRRLSEAIGRFEALAITETQEPHWRAALANAWALAAEADFVRGVHDSAREAMDKALQARVRLAQRSPDETWPLAAVWRTRAALLAALGDNSAAADSLAQARALSEQLAGRTPDDEGASRFLVHTILEQADQALRNDDLASARDFCEHARARAERLARRAPAWCAEAAQCWDRLGEIARRANALAHALDAFARSVDFRRRALTNMGADARAQRALSAALVRLGEAALDAASLALACSAFAESVALRRALLQTAPDDGRAAHALAVALERLGLAAHADGQLAAARDAWDEELSLADLIFADAALPEAMRFRAIVHAHLASTGAVRHRMEALSLLDQLAHASAISDREVALRLRLAAGPA